MEHLGSSALEVNEVFSLQVIGCEVHELPVSEVQQALFVLDRLNHIPDSKRFLKILKDKNVHIIIIYEGCESTSKLIKEVDFNLLRGCTVLNISPLTVIHSTQRIVHSVMKDHGFTPTNRDQLFFENLAEITVGSPPLVDVATQIVCSIIAEENEATVDLSEHLPLGKAYPKDVQTCSISRDSDDDSVVHHSELSDVWSTDTEYDSWDSAVALIDSCNLTTEERLLLNVLSVFSGCPVPYSMVTELALVIANSCKKPHFAGTLPNKLTKFRLLCDYPHPVVIHNSIHGSTDCKEDKFKLVYVPHYISQCVYRSLNNLDTVVVLNLAYHTLYSIYPSEKPSESYTLTGLCSLLLETCDTNFALIGKECYQNVYALFLKCAP